MTPNDVLGSSEEKERLVRKRRPSFHQIIRARRMRAIRTVFTVTFFLTIALYYISGSHISADDLVERFTRSKYSERAAAIKEAYLYSWDAYKEHAWGHDEFKPITKTFQDPRNAWGATIVDGLSTAILMELEEAVHDSLVFIEKIDYTKTNDMVSLFETTIRYLGGMLSGYDLLKGPYKHLVRKEDKRLVDALLTQSISLANALSFAFETKSGVPSNELNFQYRRLDQPYVNSVATVGTLVLEWTRLSQLTGNETYAKLAEKGQAFLLDPKPEMNEPFPGLLGTHISLEDGQMFDATGGWSSESDSFYEYLLKMYMFNPSKYKEYGKRWLLAADSSLKYLRHESPFHPDAIFIQEYFNTSMTMGMGHLTCFAGGNIMMGGRLFGKADLEKFGYELANGCIHVYKTSPLGIAPERWAFDLTGRNMFNEEDFNRTGYYGVDANYYLRPEAIESVYYAYAYAKTAAERKRYADDAWDMFKAINASCYVETGGYTGLRDVVKGLDKTDTQESFWLAETLKYFWLIFNGEGRGGVGVKSTGKWIFNTEAHPLAIQH